VYNSYVSYKRNTLQGILNKVSELWTLEAEQGVQKNHFIPVYRPASQPVYLRQITCNTVRQAVTISPKTFFSLDFIWQIVYAFTVFLVCVMLFYKMLFSDTVKC